jgi:UDP-GlcNAc:undecaprenyl-phosphate GlcNAc-1-phosphate transferase
MEISGLDYLAVFAVTTSIALGLTPIALRVALRRQILDHPGEIKAQASPVPYLGGLAIVVSFALVVFVAASIRQPDGGYGELVTILGLGVVLALVGLLDDLRGLSPFLRLGIEIAAAVLVWRSQGAAVFDNEPLDLAVTVLWIVGVTNALNLLDNMDGLTAGVSAIAAFFVFVVAVDSGQFLVATLAIALAGCALGFLRSNFHPARIYMGDAGALFLGFTLAVLTLKIDLVRAPTINGLGVPILLLGVPLFDTTLVTINRLLHRRSPLSGGRDHTSHRLVFVGIPVPAAVSLVYLGGASLGCLAVVLSRLDQTTAIVLLGWVIAVAAFFGVLLSLVPVYETSKRRRLVLREVMAHEVEPVTVDERDDPAAEPLDRAVGDG